MPSKKQTIKLDNTLRISKASELLGVTPMTLRRWEEAGYLKPLRVGPRQDRRYSKEQILKILDQGISK